MSVRSHALKPFLLSGHLRMPSASAMGAALAHAVLWPLRILVRLQARAFERETVARLDDRMLRDVGLTRADLRAEVKKPVWH